MGLSPEVQQLCTLHQGLVLVTGPTGSGKSTTLCAMVDLVNRSRADHILTIEDPIEFVTRASVAW
jgi:twitching motility protein PilT